MRNLFLFFYRNQFFTLFVILEIVSLLLLSNSRSYQRSLRYNTVSDFTGSVFSGYSSITHYFGLITENEKLVAENAHLRTLLSGLANSSDSIPEIVDSLYRYIPARVVSNSVTKQSNLIMVDKGLMDGVKKEMGAISSNGLVGIVIGISDHYSVIMSMLHHNMRISARIKANNQLVNVVWNQSDYQIGTITDIPSHLQLAKGDSIITSGNSLIFPEDILIGTVENHTREQGEHLGSAVIRFSTDFNSLKHVYLIENFMVYEQNTLLMQIQE
jgi:rod shape-determining protein MreC